MGGKGKGKGKGAWKGKGKGKGKQDPNEREAQIIQGQLRRAGIVRPRVIHIFLNDPLDSDDEEMQ